MNSDLFVLTVPANMPHCRVVKGADLAPNQPSLLSPMSPSPYQGSSKCQGLVLRMLKSLPNYRVLGRTSVSPDVSRQSSAMCNKLRFFSLQQRYYACGMETG